jgi:hypothetical protein
MNIKDIKVTYRSEGPNIKWPYLRKLHPAIPIIRVVINFIEHQFGTIVRGKKHSVPSKEKDIAKLRASFSSSKLHKQQPGRKIPGSGDDHAPDFATEGVEKVVLGNALANLNEGRAFERSTREEWPDEGEVVGGVLTAIDSGREVLGAGDGPLGAVSDGSEG